LGENFKHLLFREEQENGRKERKGLNEVSRRNEKTPGESAAV